MSVASSLSAFELFTRFEPATAANSRSAPASIPRRPSCRSANGRTARAARGPAYDRGPRRRTHSARLMIMAHDLSARRSPRFFHSSHRSSDCQHRRAVAGSEVPGLLAAGRVLPFVIARHRHEAALRLERLAKERLGRHRLDFRIEGRDRSSFSGQATRSRSRENPSNRPLKEIGSIRLLDPHPFSCGLLS